MSNLVANLPSAFRFFRRRALPILLLVATLASGLALVILVGSVVNSVLLRPLPYGNDPARLMMVWCSTPTLPQIPFSYPNFLDLQARSTAFEHLAVSQRRDIVVAGAREPERVEGILVSSGYFPIMAVPPSAGRYIEPADDRPESPRVAVISHGLWQRWYGSEASVVGRTILVDSVPYNVIGVANSRLATLKADIWIPVAPFINRTMMDRSRFVLRVLGEVKPGVSQTTAQAQVSRIASDLAREHPDTNGGVGAYIIRLDDLIVRSVRTPVLLLFAGAMIILSVAWFHLASVFLTLALERMREAGIRLALGATRIDLFRLFFTEVGANAIGAWLLAIVIGRAGIRFFIGTAPNLVPRFDETNIDTRVAVTALLVCIGSALLIAMWLTWSISSTCISAIINESRGGVTGPRHRFRSAHFLLAGQVAVTVGLAICAIFLLQEYRRIQSEGAGFAEPRNLTARVSLPGVSYPKSEARIRFFEQLIDELHGVPGLDRVSAVSRVPLSSDGRFKGIELEGQPSKASDWNTADYFSAMPGYFQTIGIPMLAGRDFKETDTADAPGVVIIDERFAARFWPNQSALGKKVRIGGNANEQRPWLEVVGIVAHVRDDVGRNAIPFQAYFPYYQDPGPLMTLTVRSLRPTQDVLTSMREKLRRLDPRVPLYFVSTLESIVAESLAAQRTATALLGLFALFALVLSIAGTYGIVSGSVTGRERELSVRMALGASHTNIVGLVLRETFVCVAISHTPLDRLWLHRLGGVRRRASGCGPLGYDRLDFDRVAQDRCAACRVSAPLGSELRRHFKFILHQLLAGSAIVRGAHHHAIVPRFHLARKEYR